MSYVTFLSDYGLDDSFVGVCHGVIARVAPDVRIIDVCHQILPQDVAQGALTLAGAVPYLPVGVHLALVDPVGSVLSRPVVVVTRDGALFVSPDNGICSRAWPVVGGVERAYEVTNDDVLMPRPSKLFRGRDVFAPVAGRLASGLDPAEVGKEIDPDTLERLPESPATVHGDHVHGSVVAIDHFGNLALNVARSDLEAAGLALGDTIELRAGGRAYQVPLVLTYGEVPAGRLAVCENAYRRITVAVNMGSAAGTLRSNRGDPIVVARAPRAPAETARRIGVLDPPPRP